MGLMDKLENALGIAVAVVTLGLAIEYSPGNTHMKSYIRAGEIADINNDGITSRGEWDLVYDKLSVPKTRWAGFDLSTEQLDSYSDSLA